VCFSGKKGEEMASRKISDAVPIIGIGFLGFVHEFVISNRLEIFPIILFGLLLAKGITKLFEK